VPEFSFRDPLPEAPQYRTWRKGGLLFVGSTRNDGDGNRFRVVSVTHEKRPPTWDELLDARRAFYEADAHVVIAVPPPEKAERRCAHLWARLGLIITPPAGMDV